MAFDGPRLRRDLVSTILHEDGVRCVDVHDPKRGSSFRLFDYEYSVALAFDGRQLGKVIPWVRLSTGLELTAEQLMAFAERLGQLGFLEPADDRTPGIAPANTPALVTRVAAEAARTPVPVPSPPAPAEPPVPVPSPPAPAEPPLPVPSPPVTVQTPVPIPSPPVIVEAPVPIPSPPPTVEAPVPVPSPPAPAEPPLPVSEPPTAGEKDAPELAPPEALPAAESRPAGKERAAEPVLPKPGTTWTEIASLDVQPAAEPPAAVVSASPDLPLQAQALLPAADATPLPVETPPTAGTPEPPPVPSETRPLDVPDQAPSPTPAATPTLLPEPQSRMSDGEAVESASRPYPVQRGARTLTPGPRRILTPPPIPTPTPMLTPAPWRSATVRGGPWVRYALLGTLAALVVGVLVVPVALGPHPPSAVRVRVLVASPTAVVRWFDGSAPVEVLPSQVLSFPAGGKVIRLASPGIPLRPGDVVAATDAARGVLADLARQQERLAYSEQIAQGVRDAGDGKRASTAQAKVQINAGLVAQTQAALSRVAIVAQAAGQVEASLAILGRTVQPGAPAVRMRLAGWRASLELPRALVTRFRRQGWCAAEIEGRPAACNLAPDGGDETHVVIELAPEVVTVPGQPVRLARARFAEAFLVPASALSRVGDSDRVLLVAPTGRAEVRNVAVADRNASDAVITQGLDAGDAVIIETSQPVVAGAQVQIAGATRE